MKKRYTFFAALVWLFALSIASDAHARRCLRKKRGYKLPYWPVIQHNYTTDAPYGGLRGIIRPTMSEGTGGMTFSARKIAM